MFKKKILNNVFTNLVIIFICLIISIVGGSNVVSNFVPNQSKVLVTTTNHQIEGLETFELNYTLLNEISSNFLPELNSPILFQMFSDRLRYISNSNYSDNIYIEPLLGKKTLIVTAPSYSDALNTLNEIENKTNELIRLKILKYLDFGQNNLDDILQIKQRYYPNSLLSVKYSDLIKPYELILFLNDALKDDIKRRAALFNEHRNRLIESSFMQADTFKGAQFEYNRIQHTTNSKLQFLVIAGFAFLGLLVGALLVFFKSMITNWKSSK